MPPKMKGTASQAGTPVKGSRAPSESSTPPPQESPLPALTGPIGAVQPSELLASLGSIDPAEPEADEVVEHLFTAATLKARIDAMVGLTSSSGRKVIPGTQATDLLRIGQGFEQVVRTLSARLVGAIRQCQRLEGRLAEIADVSAAVDGLSRVVGGLKEAKTFAQAVEAGPSKPSAVPRPQPGRIVAGLASVPAQRDCDPTIVMVEPLPDSNLDSAEKVREALQAAVDPIEAGWSVVNLRKRGRGVEVRTRSARDAERVTSSSALGNAGLSARVVDREMPRVLLYDVPRELDEPRILSALKAQNSDGSAAFAGSSWGRLSHFTGPRDGPTRNVVLYVSPGVRTHLVSRGRVSIGWRRCRVIDFVSVTRCYRCQEFGHVRARCKAPRDVCSHCAGDHDRSACPASGGPAKCAPCAAAGKPSDHGVGARDVCWSYARVFRRRVELTRYDE